jgi:hypothetical protein
VLGILDGWYSMPKAKVQHLQIYAAAFLEDSSTLSFELLAPSCYSVSSGKFRSSLETAESPLPSDIVSLFMRYALYIYSGHMASLTPIVKANVGDSSDSQSVPATEFPYLSMNSLAILFTLTAT